ncbi:UNVERIFIED_ORG: hypothetical protein ABIB13_002203 [Arthrobacter sp. UYEF2]
MSPLRSPDSALIEALVKTASAYPSDRTSPQAFVLAVGTRAFSLGLTENDLRRFLLKQTDSHPGLSDLLSNRFAFRRFLSATQSAAFSSSPQGAEKNALRTARLTLGRILSPVDVPEGEPGLSAARMIRARATLAMLGDEQLKSIRSEGWNTIMVSRPWLALRAGTSSPTAKASLDDLVSMGWIRPVGGVRSDSARRFKASGKLTRAQGQVIPPDPDHLLYQAIGNLAGLEADPDQVADVAQLNDEPNRVSELIQSVTHPAWSYGSEPLSFRTWLVALATAAEVDPSTLDVGSRYIPKARKALAAAGVGDTSGLTAALDSWAQQTGAFEAAAQAKATYKEAAAERTSELARVRAIRADVKAELDRLVGPVSSFPAAGSSRDLVNEWLHGATGVVARQVLVEARHKAMVRELGKRFSSRGWERDTAIKLTEIVMGKAGSLIGAEDSIPEATEDAAVKQAWLQGMAEKMTAHTLEDPDRDAARVELAAKLRRRGYGEKAQKLVELLLGSQAQAT